MKDKLINAIKTNDIWTVRTLTRQSPELLELPLDDDAYYAIHYAAEFGYVNSVKLILDACPRSLNQKTVLGYTPLMIALGSCDTLSNPIGELANQITMTLTGFTYTVDYHAVVRHLLTFDDIDLYAKVNCPKGPYHEYRAFDLAYAERYIQFAPIFDELKKCGAISHRVLDLDHTDENIQSILRARKVSDVIQRLDAHPDLLKKKDEHDTPMLQLSLYMNIQVFEYLAERFSAERTLKNHLNRVFSDLTKAPDKYDAAWFGYLKILIEQGIDLDRLRWENGKYLIHFAVMHDKLFKFLIKHRRDRMNQLDDFGRTPFIYAAQKHQQGAVQFLVELGVDQHHVLKSHNTTAIYYAAQCSLDMFSLLDEKPYISPERRLLGDGSHLVHISCLAVLEKLLADHPGLINLRNNKGHSLLIIWALDDSSDGPNVKKLELLLSKNPNLEYAIDDPDSKYHGFTVLDIVKIKGRSEYSPWNPSIKKLKSAGARDDSLLRARAVDKTFHPNSDMTVNVTLGSRTVDGSLSHDDCVPSTMSNGRVRFYPTDRSSKRGEQESPDNSTAGLRFRHINK